MVDPATVPMDLLAFVESHLPNRPARVLEVGCGEGHLSRCLAARGLDVTGIDPEAPKEPLFERVRVEDFEVVSPFDAVVAIWSLHHMHDLGPALDKIADSLTPEGRLILDEFGWERMDQATSAWYFKRRKELERQGLVDHVPATLDACRNGWAEEHAHLHTSSSMLEEINQRFELHHFQWVPYLYRDSGLGDPSSEALERELITKGKIQPIGFRLVGKRR